MKWMTLITALLFLSGCCFTSALICSERASATIVEPLMVFPYSNGPVDVTTTTIDYY